MSTNRVLDSKRLFYFYHVARLGGFTSAEAYLGVAQPALSRQVQLLEAELGVVLLQRETRGVVLTDMGRIVYGKAEQMLRLMDDTLLELEGCRTQPAGKVTVAATLPFITMFMPQVVSNFAAAFPNVQLRVMQCLTGQIYNMLACGDVDLAILPDPPISSKLVLEELFSEQLYLVGQPSAKPFQQNAVRASQLEQLRLVLPASTLGLRSTIDKFAQSAGVKLPVAIELDSLALIKAVVTKTVAYTILPITSCREDVREGRLAAYPLEPVLMRSSYLGSIEGRPLSVAARMLAREISKVVRETHDPELEHHVKA